MPADDLRPYIDMIDPTDPPSPRLLVSEAELAEALRDHDHQPRFNDQPGPEVIGSLLSMPLRIRRDHLTVTALIDGDEPNYVGCAAAIFAALAKQQEDRER